MNLLKSHVMKKLLFLISLYVPLFLQAQEFDLNKYKYRFQRYQSAQFNFNFTGNNDYRMNRQKYIDKISNSPTTHYNTDKNTLNLSIGLPFNFYRIINTEDLQHNQSLNFSSGFSSTNEIRNNFKGGNMNLQYNVNNRYYNSRKFTELNYGINTNTYYYNSMVDQQPFYYRNSRNNYNSGSFNLNIGTGKGRLEYVSDAVTTMFLLQDLKRKAGIGNYTNEQIENIAKGITKIYNTRFMDFRYRLIDQLTLLDSTLTNNGIASTSAIKYFTIINDNWVYANRFQRMSGSRWSVLGDFTGNSAFSVYRSKASDTSSISTRRYQSNYLYSGLSFNYAWSKQLGLKAQRSFNAKASSGYNFTTQQYSYSSDNQSSTDNKNKPDRLNSAITIDYGYLYQPNTRTYIQVELNLSTTYNYSLYGSRVSNPDHSKYDQFQTQLTPRLSVFKFFNPHFNYNLTASMPAVSTVSKNSGDKRLTDINSSYQFPLTVNMGFTYTFF